MRPKCDLNYRMLVDASGRSSTAFFIQSLLKQQRMSKEPERGRPQGTAELYNRAMHLPHTGQGEYCVAQTAVQLKMQLRLMKILIQETWQAASEPLTTCKNWTQTKFISKLT